jgi:hypothetical protein
VKSFATLFRISRESCSSDTARATPMVPTTEDSPFAAMRVFDFENQCASAGAASPSEQLPTGIMNTVKQTIRCVLIDEDQRS